MPESDETLLGLAGIALEPHPKDSSWTPSREASADQIGRKLADLVEETPISASAEPMDPKKHSEYLDNLKKRLDGFRDKNDEDYDNVQVEKTDKGMTITVGLKDEHGNDASETITHSYEKGCPRVTMTNPPSDQSIFLFMQSSKGIAPLTLEKPCGNAETAMRLFEASVISGVKTELTDDDKQLLESSPEYRDRYATLKLLENPANSGALKTFREMASRSGYELGASDLPKFEKPLVGGDLGFKGKTPDIPDMR